MNKGCFKKGYIPFNKGLKQTEWIRDIIALENVRKTQFPNQKWSEMSIRECRLLPHNTKEKGTITRRLHIHTKGKNKGKIDVEWIINIDWRGNRKPNNLYKKYVWEKAHQMDIPKGYVVYLKDQNPDNIVPENLELITRAELLKRNTGKGE